MVADDNTLILYGFNEVLLNNDTIVSVKEISNGTDYVTVEYTFWSKRKLISKLKKINLSDIKAMLAYDQYINLDLCYIENFDSSQLIDNQKENIKIKKFSSNFSYYVGKTDFSKIEFGEEDVSLKGCVFSSDYTNFNNTSFGTGDTDFSLSVFHDGDVTFRKAKFGNGNVKFNKIKFGKGEIDFHSTNFGDGNVDFHNTDFGSGDTTFVLASFGNSNVDFRFTVFRDGEIDFTDASISNGYLDFRDTVFKNCEVDFSYFVLDNCEVNFNYSLAENTRIIFKECKFLKHDNLRFESVKLLEIVDCIIDGTLLMNSHNNYKVCIEELSMRDTKNLGKIFIDWATAEKAITKNVLKKTNTNKKIYKSKSKIKRLNNFINIKSADQMKMLKENYHNLGEYEWEDEAFVEYMRYTRKSKNLIARFPSWVIDLISGYGTKPFHLFATMMAAVAIFGLLFSDIFVFTSIVDKPEIVQGYNGIFQGLYFSIITFLTIGYGDVSPLNTVTAFLAGVEGFLGLFLMSYFTVSVVRKTLR